MIIAITGTIASGKGKVADILKKKGFEHHSFSSEIRAVAKERGIEVNRLTLSKLGADLRKESPHDSILAKRILEKVKLDKDYVVDGLRDMDEVQSLERFEKEKGKRFILVGIDADPHIRFERLKKRGRHGDPKTFEEFKKIDDKELEGSAGQEVGKCLEHASYILMNDGDLKDLEKKLDELLSAERD
ncbi:MAG: AAA family ATPase [Candidatus Bathyarchaeota archaeon]|nr:AAA family ATPase [Candidatus Bathyarchaeota archaeon]